MEKLIQEARIHLLFSKQATGAKLKVINALQSNGHVLVNSLIIEGTNLSEFCLICDTPEAFQLNIQNLFDQELSSESFQKRKDYFEQTMNVVENCRVIETLI